jgi:ferritin-like metal-binding protein YciE
MKKAVLHELFVMNLQDLYSAETQLIDALPMMAEAASDEELKAGFEAHLVQTQEHASKLEALAEEMDIEIDGMTCEGMEGLIAEGEHVMEADLDVRVKDIALIGAAEKVEHYEHYGYEMAEKLAMEMGHSNAEKVLKQIKNQEIETAELLQKAAKRILKEIED